MPPVKPQKDDPKQSTLSFGSGSLGLTKDRTATDNAQRRITALFKLSNSGEPCAPPAWPEKSSPFRQQSEASPDPSPPTSKKPPCKKSAVQKRGKSPSANAKADSVKEEVRKGERGCGEEDKEEKCYLDEVRGGKKGKEVKKEKKNTVRKKRARDEVGDSKETFTTHSATEGVRRSSRARGSAFSSESKREALLMELARASADSSEKESDVEERQRQPDFDAVSPRKDGISKELKQDDRQGPFTEEGEAKEQEQGEDELAQSEEDMMLYQKQHDNGSAKKNRDAVVKQTGKGASTAKVDDMTEMRMQRGVVALFSTGGAASVEEIGGQQRMMKDSSRADDEEDVGESMSSRDLGDSEEGDGCKGMGLAEAQTGQDGIEQGQGATKFEDSKQEAMAPREVQETWISASQEMPATTQDYPSCEDHEETLPTASQSTPAPSCEDHAETLPTVSQNTPAPTQVHATPMLTQMYEEVEREGQCSSLQVQGACDQSQTTPMATQVYEEAEWEGGCGRSQVHGTCGQSQMTSMATQQCEDGESVSACGDGFLKEDWMITGRDRIETDVETQVQGACVVVEKEAEGRSKRVMERAMTGAREGIENMDVEGGKKEKEEEMKERGAQLGQKEKDTEEVGLKIDEAEKVQGKSKDVGISKADRQDEIDVKENFLCVNEAAECPQEAEGSGRSDAVECSRDTDSSAEEETEIVRRKKKTRRPSERFMEDEAEISPGAHRMEHEDAAHEASASSMIRQERKRVKAVAASDDDDDEKGSQEDWYFLGREPTDWRERVKFLLRMASPSVLCTVVGPELALRIKRNEFPTTWDPEAEGVCESMVPLLKGHMQKKLLASRLWNVTL